MPAMLSLRDLQQSFLAATYDGEDGTAIAAVIAGQGMAPAARLRIYRNSGTLIHTDALRTSFPAVLALLGEDCFDTAAMHYRREHPSTSGNLQMFGAAFGDFLAGLPALQAFPYVADVARLEGLRQQVALATPAEPATPAACAAALNGPAADRLVLALHRGLRMFASPHAVLTLWRHAMAPDPHGLRLPASGEQIVLWPADGEVAMAALDTASFACIEALLHGASIAEAAQVGLAFDPAFDPIDGIASLIDQGLVLALALASGAAVS